VTLFWGLRSERDLYYQDELETLARRHANFNFLTTLSRPEGSWKGQTGRVTRLVDERIASVDNLAVYLCGNSGMIKDVSAIINRRGLCPIYREKYMEEAAPRRGNDSNSEKTTSLLLFKNQRGRWRQGTPPPITNA